MSKIDVTILIDRSGSMSSMQREMEDALKVFLTEQSKDVDNDIRLSVHTFDNFYETTFLDRSVREVNYIKIEPRGSTALTDSLCRCIDETGARLARLPESLRPEKVMFIVITDGLENASRTFNRTDVATRIRHQSDKYNWQFLFMGANQDSFQEAATYGFNPNLVNNYDVKTAGGIRALYSTMDVALNSYKTSWNASIDPSLQVDKDGNPINPSLANATPAV